MAKCTKCGKQVGCGCGLKGGLCSTCIKNSSTPSTPTPIVHP